MHGSSAFQSYPLRWEEILRRLLNGQFCSSLTLGTWLAVSCMAARLMMDSLYVLAPHLSALMCFPVTCTLRHLSEPRLGGLHAPATAGTHLCSCTFRGSCHRKSSSLLVITSFAWRAATSVAPVKEAYSL